MAKGEDQSRPNHCRTCGAELHGPYCSACGESHVQGRLAFRAVAEDMIEGIANFDTRVMRTVGDLCVAPAKVCRDYLEGRRILYVNPFRYALVGVVLSFVILELTLRGQGVPSRPHIAMLMEVQLRWGQLVWFLMMPALAAILMGLFIKAPRKLRWIEHYVVVLYALGHAALLQGVLGPLVPYFGQAGMVFGLLPVVWLSWIAAEIYEVPWWSAALRVVAAWVVVELCTLGVLELVMPS